jgi:hypothetical protein
MNNDKHKPSFFDNKYARILTVGLCSAIFYGSWAAYSNWDYGLAISGKAAVVQGIAFGIAATCSASLMEFLFRMSNNLIIRYLASSLGAGLIMLTIFIIIHLINDTPNIFLTILPPTIIATPYYALYPLELARRELLNNPENVTINSKLLNNILSKFLNK